MFHLVVNGQQCPGPIGTNDEVKFNGGTQNRFYLNTAVPAPCSGTVSNWRYCYYKNTDVKINQSFFASFAVYRHRTLNNSQDSQYEKISEMFNITLTGMELNAEQNFTCKDVNTPEFNIEAGDMVGACVFNPNGKFGPRRLNIARKPPSGGYSMLQMRASGCSLDLIPSIISSNDLMDVNSTILHVYAKITSTSLIY